jgi:hypothetical protein
MQPQIRITVNDEFWKKQLQPLLKYHPSINLEWLIKTTEIIRFDDRSQGQNLNPGHFKYELFNYIFSLTWPNCAVQLDKELEGKYMYKIQCNLNIMNANIMKIFFIPYESTTYSYWKYFTATNTCTTTFQCSAVKFCLKKICSIKENIFELLFGMC